MCLNFLDVKMLFQKLNVYHQFFIRVFSSKSYFVTSPIFYVNGAPHIGHLQSCLYADVFARMQCLLGNEVVFSTGTDEHGQKVQQAADAIKKQPMEYCTEMSNKFQEIFKLCDVSFTHFIRTTDAKHKETVQNFWIKLKDRGYVKKGCYEGWYSVTDEAFVPSSQVKEIKEKNITKMVSVETGSVVEKMSEENYVFLLSHFQNDLLYWLSKDVIRPSNFLDDIKRWVSEGLNDLSISRPKSRLSWGVPVPDDDSQIIYVWLDALISYLTIESFTAKNVWPVNYHIIGKDILKFHAIYWPAFLIAAGYDPPGEIFCHSHWTVNYEKMSKSKGNVIDPVTLMQKYDCDGFRYFLIRASVPHSDTNYSEVKMHRLLNAELADTMGNLLSRSCAPALNPAQVFPKFCHQVLEKLHKSEIESLINQASSLPEQVQQHFLAGYFYKGLDCVMECLRNTNAFMEHNKPWELVKSKEEESKQKLSTVLHVVLEVLRLSGILLLPVVPTLSNKLLEKLGVPMNQRNWQNIKCFQSYHHLCNELEDKSLGKDCTPLYERRKQN